MSLGVKKRVVAFYTAEVYFKIPKHINLEDDKQVKDYWVKWNCLYISLCSGEVLEIEPNFDLDWKFPTELEIEIDSDSESESESEE
jgi:hypothetical protein